MLKKEQYYAIKVIFGHIQKILNVFDPFQVLIIFDQHLFDNKANLTSLIKLSTLRLKK